MLLPDIESGSRDMNRSRYYPASSYCATIWHTLAARWLQPNLFHKETDMHRPQDDVSPTDVALLK
jgi:hypothetical protein